MQLKAEFAQELIDTALKCGAQDADVYQSSSFSRPVTFESNRLKQLESSESTGTALRIWRDGRPGLAVAYGAFEAQTLVDKAIALSQLNEVNPPDFCKARKDINPPIGTEISVETFIEMGKVAIAQLREAYPDLICHGSFECDHSETLLLNSKGLYCEAADISLSYFLETEWVRGDDFLAVYDGEVAQDKLQPQATIQSILQRLQWATKNTMPSTGQVPVLFTSNAASMLWSTVASALNGKLILEGSSPWSRAAGKQIISPEISLYQDPTAKPYICHFDDEGTQARSLSLIREGTVQEFYGDRHTSKELNIRPTGNGFRPSLGRYPTPELINLIVAPGKKQLSEMIAELQDAIIVDQILGGGADLSGDFSVNIDLGYQVKNGEVIGRVKDTMVSGNVYEALKNVVEVGGDRHWQGSCLTPSILLESLSITG
ncbi:peptidase U62 modulator of DNA gyrase [[Leptolyngbya] sp. PCC 7376]|uniref:TldD/PmbA family protein n=1 Tax=[Leptolyngbya] sp. PCC 7376 TaxID=111781 RepID=UPI00029EF8E9|nr:TldD/PmbA family protein [[Leptolyngbya] sp. PCC 7376]AFY38354.1 peptidase U62 modulator of DNA gyrase [[Leptolyngbya] sp. PCC 7376]